MKFRNFLPLTCALLLCLPLGAQNAEQDNLPSAPSAAKPKPQAPPAPTKQVEPAPQQSAPAAQSEKPDADPVASADTKSAKPAEPSPPQDDDTVSTIRTRVNEVNVVFTVTDKHGHYVKDLKKDDFKILDDAKQASDISSFRAETDLPLDVGLLIDASNSVRDRFKFEQESAIEFLNQTVRRKYDHAFVIGFDVTPEVTQDFT